MLREARGADSALQRGSMPANGELFSENDQEGVDKSPIHGIMAADQEGVDKSPIHGIMAADLVGIGRDLEVLLESPARQSSMLAGGSGVTKHDPKRIR
jgi:hypothetical protein